MLRPWRRNREHRSRPQPDIEPLGYDGQLRRRLWEQKGVIVHDNGCVTDPDFPMLVCLREDHPQHLWENGNQ